jgi:hypothetical protein
MNNWLVVGFTCIVVLWILIFKGFTTRRFYESFGVKGLILEQLVHIELGFERRQIHSNKYHFCISDMYVMVWL